MDREECWNGLMKIKACGRTILYHYRRIHMVAHLSSRGYRALVDRCGGPPPKAGELTGEYKPSKEGSSWILERGSR